MSFFKILIHFKSFYIDSWFQTKYTKVCIKHANQYLSLICRKLPKVTFTDRESQTE